MSDTDNTPRQKQCPACGQAFECSAGNCWCDDVPVSDAKRIQLRRFSDCVCPECLRQPAKIIPAQ